jgi:4,5-dihydroxyphthalate decarboxylase
MKMSRVSITLACEAYDRVRGLIDGTVDVEGVDLNFIPLGVEEIFWRQIKHHEFDASECSLSSYTMLRSKGDETFIAIPVFTSRAFRHASIFINIRKGISTPGDLKGKVVGVPEYQMTAAVWERGILADEYGVNPHEISWRSGGEENPGREEKVKLDLPSNVHYEPIPADKTLSQMLDNGEIDALFTARAPSCYSKNSPNVARLFENYREVEEEYYKKTGIFPIMHVIVIKREIYKHNPWIAMSLYKAFSEAKKIALKSYSKTEALGITLPWVIHEVDETRKVMGDDWWSYGIAKNHKTLETFLCYHYEQGLSAEKMTVKDLFAVETFDEFKI